MGLLIVELRIILGVFVEYAAAATESNGGETEFAGGEGKRGELGLY